MKKDKVMALVDLGIMIAGNVPLVMYQADNWNVWVDKHQDDSTPRKVFGYLGYLGQTAATFWSWGTMWLTFALRHTKKINEK